MADGNVQDFFERVADSKMADGIGWRVAPGFTVIKASYIKYDIKVHMIKLL